MITYDVFDAYFDRIVLNENDISDLSKGAKFFLLVDVHNRQNNKITKYQIKLNEIGGKNNINEFIAHYIGRCSDMPLVDGAFLKLPHLDIKKILNSSHISSGRLLRDIDFSSTSNGIFFGVEWKQHITRIDSEKELLPRVLSTSNKTSFFSLFAFDQYLKNYDRHLGNHLIVKEGKKVSYKLIDFDRIFGSNNWGEISNTHDCFLPFVESPTCLRYHKLLMELVAENTIKYVHDYAAKLQSITDVQIEKLCDMIEEVYNVNKMEVKSVASWLKHRKEFIAMKCIENEHHFPRIKKGLYSVNQ